MIDSARGQYSNGSGAVRSRSGMNGGTSGQRRGGGGRPDEMSLDVRGLLRSFQRRWFLCVSLGSLLGIAGAAVAWFVIPAPYVAAVEFYMKSYDDSVMFETHESEADFRTRKQSSQRRLRGREVITAALRDPKVNTALERIAPNAQDPVKWLSEHLQIAANGTEFFKVRLSGENPNALPLILNAVATAFMENVVYAAQDERNQELKILQQGLISTQKKLDQKHEALKAMFEKTNSANPQMSEQRYKFLLELHVTLRERLGEVELELIQAKAQQDYLKGNEEDPVKISDAVIDAHAMQNPDYQALVQHVDQYRSYLERSIATYSEGHPRIAEARKFLANAEADLEQLRKELRPEIRERLRKSQLLAGKMTDTQLTEHIRQLAALKVKYQQELDGLELKEQKSGLMTLELQRLDRDIAQLEKMSATLESEIKRREFELEAPNATLPIQIYQDAQVPHAPDLKTRLAGTGMAGLGLFAAVLVGIVFLDWRSRRISSINELSQELPLRLIGSIPAMPRSALNAPPSSGRRSQKNLFWQSAFKESIDAARTLLVSESERVGHRAIMIASACSSEGKTTLASHLATSLARAGRRVILVDCDLRRPSVHRVFGVEEGPGVCELMRSELELAETIQEGPIAGLDILAAGQIDATALEYLAGNALVPVFSQLRDDYDFVIVDSSPVLPVCDAMLVAQLVDGVMVSVRRDISRAGNVAAAVHRFNSIGIPVLGAVTIGLDDDPIGYGGYFRSRARLRYGQDYLVGAS